jgi:hypothetical protein
MLHLLISHQAEKIYRFEGSIVKVIVFAKAHPAGRAPAEFRHIFLNLPYSIGHY